MHEDAVTRDMPPPFVLPPVLVVGGTGRLGRLLRAAWGQWQQGGLVWQSRRCGVPSDIAFAPLEDASTYRDAAGRAQVILNLAGVTAGDERALAANTDLALAALEAGHAAGVRHVFIASSAAVYGSAPTPLTETGPVSPVSDYGRAKVQMERAVGARITDWGGRGPGVTLLRIGNVAGADSLLGGHVPGVPIRLDVFATGRGPVRSFIGPEMLARMLATLFASAVSGMRLPQVLNVALPVPVAMDALLDAAGLPWLGQPAPPGVLPEVRLDTARLSAFHRVDAAQSTAAAIVADLRRVKGQVA